MQDETTRIYYQTRQWSRSIRQCQTAQERDWAGISPNQWTRHSTQCGIWKNTGNNRNDNNSREDINSSTGDINNNNNGNKKTCDR